MVVNPLLTAVVSGTTSLTVTLGSLWLSGRQQRREDEQGKRAALNARYLNPLRLHLAENHYRLSDIVRLVEARLTDDTSRC